MGQVCCNIGLNYMLCSVMIRKVLFVHLLLLGIILEFTTAGHYFVKLVSHHGRTEARTLAASPQTENGNAL